MISFEEGFRPETPTKEKAVALFKETGESPEAWDAYSAWIDQKQKEADQSKSDYSRVIFNLEISDLLLDAGLKSYAGEYMEETWEMIDSEILRVGEGNIPEELGDLYQKLKDQADRLARL